MANKSKTKKPLTPELVHLAGALGILLSVLVLSFGDLMEIIPLFAPMVASSFFPFFHETHDLLALAVVLYAAYKYNTRLALAAILLYLATNIPYFIAQFPENAPELLRLFLGIFVALLGVGLINRLHKNEQKLRAAEERYRNTLDSMLEGCQIIDFDWRYVYLNDTAVRHGQRTREALLGHTMMEVYPGIEDTEMFAYARRCMEEHIPHRMENLFTFPDGNQGWFELSIEPTPEGIFILSQDITEHKQAEAKLEQSAREWQTTFDSISDWVSVHDKDFKILRVNKAFADFLKMRPEEIIGRHCYELIHGEKEASQDCAHKEALETGKPAYKEFFNPHLGIYMEVVCSPMFDERGEITTTVHIGRDITEHKKMEAQMMATDRLASIGKGCPG